MAQESKSISIVVRIILFLAFTGGVIACLYLISEGKLSDRESALLGILGTILSVLASWIITAMYADSQYRSAIQEVKDEYRGNLKIYALKAAEKVNNLSNELNKLSIYLEEELNYTDYRTADEELLAKEERIESAIHLIRTLKSVNDTGLSDWEGVIGEELDQQREEQKEKEEELKALIARVETWIEDQRQNNAGIARYTEREEVDSLRNALRLATFQLSETSIPKRIRKKEPKHEVKGHCPSCNSDLNYSQRPTVRSIKIIPCKNCGIKLISTYSNTNGFSLKKRQQESCAAICPSCNAQNDIPLDNFPGSSIVAKCFSCNKLFRLSRTASGSDIKAIEVSHATGVTPGPRKVGLSESLIGQIRDSLPPQPWPTGTHRSVAETLNLPPTLVSHAISILIHRGIFLPQADGAIIGRGDSTELRSVENSIDDG